MSEQEFPKEAGKTVYQRDKTAKEPVPAKDPPKPPVKPKIKPRKVFVAKKMVARDQPMEYRARHILVSSKEAAELFRQSILDFQKELAEQPMDDPDKEFHDLEKVERFFARLAKKYSTCPSKSLGGDLDWVHEGMEIKDEILTPELVDTVIKTPKNTVPEPVKSPKGFHILLVCENRPYVRKEKPAEGPSPKIPPSGVPG